jgi:hypothetical protein
MESLIKLCKNIGKLNRENILIDIYEKKRFQQYVLDKNRLDQLFYQGIDANGYRLVPYSANTVVVKRRKNQPIDRTTLKDTGEFYDTFVLIFSSDLDYMIGADDEDKGLFDRYGNDILGWTKENKDEIIIETQKTFIEKTKSQIFKGLE